MIEAQNYMKSLMTNKLTISQVADNFVLKFPELVYELSKVIDRCFNLNNSEKKVMCIILVCQILKKSLAQGTKRKFLKGLAQRLRYFLHDLTRHYVSEGMALNISQNIEQLKQTGLFCDQYFEKLQFLAKNIKENSNPEGQNLSQKSQSFEEDQKKYTRTFLLTLKDLNTNKTTKAIYETYAYFIQRNNEDWGRPDKSLMGSLDLQNSHGSFSDIKADSLEGKITQRESREERLERIMKECHSHILELKSSMENQVRRYEENITSGDFDRLGSQYSIAE